MERPLLRIMTCVDYGNPAGPEATLVLLLSTGGLSMPGQGSSDGFMSFAGLTFARLAAAYPPGSRSR